MSKIPTILKQYESDLLTEWLSQQKSILALKEQGRTDGDLREQSHTFLNLVQQAAQGGNVGNTEAAEWKPVRDFLQQLSSERARRGYSPTETATFIFSLKQP